MERQYLFWSIQTSSRCFNEIGGYFLFGHAVSVISDEFVKKIEMDRKAFHLEEQFTQLPVDFQTKYSFLSAFSNNNPFIEQNTELLKEMNKADKDRVSGTVYIAGMPKAETIKRKMYENVKFVFENNLLLSLFDEFKSYIKNSLLVWLEAYAHNINHPSKSEKDDLHSNIYYKLTYLDIILISETFSYDDVKYLSNIINLESIPFDDEERLVKYIDSQIKDFIQVFPRNGKLKGNTIILFMQQVKRLRLLLMISTYFVKNHEFIKNVLRQMDNLRVINFPLPEMKQIIVRWVNISKLDKKSAIDIIEEWFISYLKELSPNIGVDDKLPGVENTGEFVDMISKLCTEETRLTRITLDTMTLLKENLAYTKLFNPLYMYLNTDMKAYIDSHVPVESIISLNERYGDKIPDDFDISHVVENTFKTIENRLKKRETGVITSYQYSSDTLITNVIIAMLRKGIEYKEHVGINHEYDFWFDFDNFERCNFDVQWLNYYPDDILQMIKNDVKKQSLVIDILEKNSSDRILDGWNLRRQYYVYRYLTK